MTTLTKLLSIATLVASSVTLVAAAGSVPAGKPEEAGLVTIIMMQTSTPQLQRDFENAVMQAIID